MIKTFFSSENCIWGNWTETWSTCNETCGDYGTETKTRTKVQEVAGGGDDCIGEATKYQDCNRIKCPSNKNFNFENMKFKRAKQL